MTTAMHAEQAELERQLDDLKLQLERVRGRRFKSYGDDHDDDARMIMCDHEGRAVFQIVTELNKVWNAMDKLKRTIANAQCDLQRLPAAPKPIARPSTSSSSSMLPPLPAPYFDAPPSGWGEREEFLASILHADLTHVPRSELREVVRNIELLEREGLATEQKGAHRRASARHTKHLVYQELGARPFDVVAGGAEQTEHRAQGLTLIIGSVVED